MAFVEDDECDYCNGKGWYLIDGERFDCECTEHPVDHGQQAQEGKVT